MKKNTIKHSEKLCSDFYERKRIAGYLLNIVQDNSCNGSLLFAIGRIIISHEDKLKIILDEPTTNYLERLDTKEQILRRDFRKKLYSGISDALEKVLVEKGEETVSQLKKNIDLVVAVLNLSESDAHIFEFVSHYYLSPPVRKLCDELTQNGLLHALPMCTSMLGLSGENFNEVLRRGRMIEIGLVELCSPGTGRDVDDCWSMCDRVKRVLAKSQGGIEDLRRLLVGTTSCHSLLEWSDFAHFGEMPERLCRFLRNVLEKKEQGINILLYGQPGTGKTEFCKAIAKELGVNLYPIGEIDDDGNEPTRNERINYLRLAQGVLGGPGSASCQLMLDEMDDILAIDGIGGLTPERKGSKIFFNRLLETNIVPTLWTINNVNLLEEATLRRMSAAIEIKCPPEIHRRQVWNKIIQKQAIELLPHEIDELAPLGLSPAVVSMAAKFSHFAGGGMEDFKFVAQGFSRAINGGKLRTPAKNETVEFIPNLTNTDICLNGLIDSLQKTPTKAFSLCLFGPPGTGKSAFVRHLAACLGLQVLVKRASDLISKYVGESEELIAAAFAEARDKEAFLIFDEADSLLGDRRTALRSWEISQVNEMLTWMESHPLPFACTTNLKDRLDPASLRRFTFKTCFNYLRSEQINSAFEHFFGMSISPEDVQTMGQLTPGDFAVVRQKSKIIGLNEPSRIAELLRQEVTFRNTEPSGKPIGFTTTNHDNRYAH